MSMAMPMSMPVAAAYAQPNRSGAQSAKDK